jgi:hypothetical protein
MKKQIFAICIGLACTGGALGSSIGATKSDSAEAPSKESREKMAAAHENMAQCLRSEATIEDCHKQMMDQCHDTNGDCPMMGKGMMQHHKAHKKQTEK